MISGGGDVSVGAGEGILGIQVLCVELARAPGSGPQVYQSHLSKS